jgi:hypothetical protein
MGRAAHRAGADFSANASAPDGCTGVGLRVCFQEAGNGHFAEGSNDDTEEPEACRPTAGRAIAAALGGFSQGVNGGSNQALEMQRERCRQARDAQRFNADHRARVAELELEQRRIELERQRLELERRRAAAEEQARAESATRGSNDPSGLILCSSSEAPTTRPSSAVSAIRRMSHQSLATTASTGATVSISISRPCGRRSESIAAFLATTQPAQCSRRIHRSS